MSLLKPINPCGTCLGASWGLKGYVPASGSGENGVLVVAEAAGQDEANEGVPLVGKSGYYFWSQLKKVGIEREGFRVHNVLSCRPPDNKLSKMSYEDEVVAHCSPLLDETISKHREVCSKGKKTPVIVTLGRIAFKRIMGLTDKHPMMRKDYQSYPHWSERYGSWVIGVQHPSFLMRGQHHLVPIMQFGVRRALEIAEKGLEVDVHEYLEDPLPAQFAQWVEGYKVALKRDPSTLLSYDIETPYKAKEGDEEKVAREDDSDYTILRCSFCYEPNKAVSVPWQPAWMPAIEELFVLDGAKVGWNLPYDSPRVRAQMVINGVELDGMLAWHVLNTSMPKGLGFVTPFYAQNTLMWKHLSGETPAFYNAKDADMALRNWLGIKDGLKANNLWKVFERHIVKLDEVLGYMGRKGVLLDQTLRAEGEAKLTILLDEVEKGMLGSIPEDAKQIEKVFKNEPKDKTGLRSRIGTRVESFCRHCGLPRPRKDHFKRYVKKLNPCADDPSTGIQRKEIEVVEWYRLREWKVSKNSMLGYQKALKHQAIVNRKENKVTFDENAIIKLQKKYPQDPLYPLILDHRGYQKLLSTYIGVTQPDGRVRGGMATGRDGRVHTLFTHNPSTLRSASQNPNLQNLPRPKGADDLATIIRNLIVPGEGHTFTARDYSGIEAVLVGYFASAPRYIRLAKIDVHSYYTAYALHELDGRVRSADLPDIGWSDARLVECLTEIKKRFKSERNNLYKHLVHAINFGQGAMGAQEKILNETGIKFPLKTIEMVMGVYKSLFPEIPRWQGNLLLQAEKDGFLRNPFGYVHRFARPFEYEKIGGRWQKKQGPEANKIWAFLPQSSAAGIIKEAMLRLYFERFEEAGQYLRLLVHDELFFESPLDRVEEVDRVAQEEMERPIMEMGLPSSYGMGSHLVILTEAKKGPRWGEMK